MLVQLCQPAAVGILNHISNLTSLLVRRQAILLTALIIFHQEMLRELAASPLALLWVAIQISRPRLILQTVAGVQKTNQSVHAADGKRRGVGREKADVWDQIRQS